MKEENGFGLLYIVALIVVAVAIVAGVFVYNHNHKTNDNQSPSNASTQNVTKDQNPASTQKYMTITEWKLKVPLSDAISDSYYVVGTSEDKNGQPNTIWLGVKSLDNVGTCAASKALSGQTPLADIVRALPGDTDPVSGQTFQQKYPDGTTLDGDYYGYNGNFIKNEPCATDSIYQAQLQNINTAFATAVKNMIAD